MDKILEGATARRTETKEIAEASRSPTGKDLGHFPALDRTKEQPPCGSCNSCEPGGPTHSQAKTGVLSDPTDAPRWVIRVRGM